MRNLFAEFPADDINIFILYFASDVSSQLDEVEADTQRIALNWSKVYDKLNGLRTQVAALNDQVTTACMCHYVWT